MVDYDDDKLYGYNITTKLRDSGKDLSLTDDNGDPEGIWSEETTLWVADDGDDKLYGYNITTKLRDSNKDFELAVGNDSPRGICSDGITLWVADDGNDKIYGYKLSDKSRDLGKDFDLAVGNDAPRGIWSDESTLWVADAVNDKIYAYNLSDKSRDSEKDFDLAVFNDAPRGIWSDETTLWVADDGNDKIYAYSEGGDCLAPVFEEPSVRNQKYTQDEEIAPVVLPAVVDDVSSASEITYGFSVDNLPEGLVYTARRITGTPTSEEEETTLIYTATDAAGNTAMLTFTMTNAFAIRDGERRGCSGIFLDSGGDRDYGNRQDITMTLVPSVSGLKIQVSFTSFETENEYDSLYIYHGERAILSQQEGGYTGRVSPETITSTSAGGQLTFEFTSDAFIVESGWLATVSCVPEPEYIAPSFGDLGITNKVYTQGEKIFPVVLPAATDAGSTTDSSLTYQLSGLPSGLTFQESTRTLSGTPDKCEVCQRVQLHCYR